MPTSIILVALLGLACGLGDDDTGDTVSEDTGERVDADGDGFFLADDCDDEDPEIHPDAPELCDGADNDCDGEIDEDDAADVGTWYPDADGDGFGSPGSSSQACEQPSGHVDNADDCDDGDVTWQRWGELGITTVIVDDYEGENSTWGDWYYSRIGTDRGGMGGGTYAVQLGGGSAQAEVIEGWAGVWTSLLHGSSDEAELDPLALLGPSVLPTYQYAMTGVEMDLRGQGTMKVELAGSDGSVVISKSLEMSGSSETLHFSLAPDRPIKLLKWVLDGEGWVEVDQVRLTVEGASTLTTPEAAFLWSYGHLCQTYADHLGLVANRARWNADDYAVVPASALFALATAVAADRGFVSADQAEDIVTDVRDALLGLPRHESGLLPHFVTEGSITAGTEWSSVDTVIALLFASQAGRATGVDVSGLEAMAQAIDWDALTEGGTSEVVHGYEEDGTRIATRWDTWGSETFLVDLAYAAAEGAALPLTNIGMTWDGAGFNDELAPLALEMLGVDAWGVDWDAYRASAAQAQLAYFAGTPMDAAGLFGLSACEVPQPWAIEASQVYQANGVGGFNGTPTDGSDVMGYAFACPHYGAMIGAEHPAAFEGMLRYLVETAGVFTPLNSVESAGLDAHGGLHWNSLKDSWNLGLQTLGAGRALYACEPEDAYTPYDGLSDFWDGGWALMMP